MARGSRLMYHPRAPCGLSEDPSLPRTEPASCYKRGMRTSIALLLAAVGSLPGQIPLTSLPYTPSLDTKFMNRAVQPCENFYVYACGNWNTLNPIPPGQARWDVYAKLTHENQLYLWGLLLEAGKTDAPRSANLQKIGDMLHACMDEEKVQAAGVAPLQPELDRIAALKSLRDLPPFLGALHLSTYVGSTLFDFGSNQDFANSSAVIAFAEAGGLGLPDRDYYTKTDAKSEEIRQKYLAHVEHMLTLLGDTPEAAHAGAVTVMRIETALAKASLTRVEQR